MDSPIRFMIYTLLKLNYPKNVPVNINFILVMREVIGILAILSFFGLNWLNYVIQSTIQIKLMLINQAGVSSVIFIAS